MPEKLLNHIIRAIGKSEEGALSFADYMALCADFYYNHKDPFGAEGDFTTASEISQMFGELIGLLFASQWQQNKTASMLVELGGGRGTLMSDIVRAGKVVDGFDAHPIYFMEQSALMKEKQKQNVPHASFIDALSDLPADKTCFLIANEFLDALPIRQFERTAEGWQERLVAYREDKFGWQLSKKTHPELPHRTKGAIAETCAASEAMVKNIATLIKRNGGMALIIDYGSDEEEYFGDTLQAVRRHQFVPLFAFPGRADLTAHLRFARLASVATLAGAKVAPLQTQKAFLESLGIQQRAETLAANATLDEQQNISAALQRLTAPSQMGGLFKVMVIYA